MFVANAVLWVSSGATTTLLRSICSLRFRQALTGEHADDQSYLLIYSLFIFCACRRVSSAFGTELLVLCSDQAR